MIRAICVTSVFLSMLVGARAFGQETDNKAAQPPATGEPSSPDTPPEPRAPDTDAQPTQPDPATNTPTSPADANAAAASDDTPATDTPAADTPAADTPAADTPATDTPAAGNTETIREQTEANANSSSDSAETPAIALEDRPHRIDAGVFLGGNFLSNGVELGNAFLDDQVPRSGFMFGFRGTYTLIRHLIPGMTLDPRLSVEVEAKLAVSSTAGNADFMRESYGSQVLGWRAHAVVSLMNDRALRPFAVLGFGGETAFSSSPFVRSVDTDAAFHWGLGATYQIAPKYGVRGDVRHGVTAGRFSLAASTIEVHAGFYYNFGFGGRPTARVNTEPNPDPIPMKTTPDPELPPKPVDTDGDGKPDDIDKCPNEAETVNEIDDEDGCPEKDEDNDNILDTFDECPEQPEDLDGFEDGNGCPDKDNDNDGRVDVIDACPTEAEVLNGFEDEDGCADEIPAEVTDALKSIRFRPRSTSVKAGRTQLDKLAALLQQHPSIKLRILGHTNDKERKPQALSEKRAAAVKATLVGAGIDGSRLETAGFGADKPVASNKTRAGKTLNRRVDFEMIPGPATLPDPTANDTPNALPSAAPTAPAGPADKPSGLPAEKPATPTR